MSEETPALQNHPHWPWTMISRYTEWKDRGYSGYVIYGTHLLSSNVILMLWQHALQMANSQRYHDNQSLHFCYIFYIRGQQGCIAVRKRSHLTSQSMSHSVHAQWSAVEHESVVVIHLKSQNTHTKVAFVAPKQRRLKKSCVELR